MLTYADVCGRMLTYAPDCDYADVEVFAAQQARVKLAP